jgi:ribosomal-protein-alanine N-acetyltransferase
MLEFGMELKYRRFIENDFDDVFELESNRDVMKFTGPGKALTKEESKVRFMKLLACNYDEPYGYWFVSLSNKFIAWLMLIPEENKCASTAEVGFMVHPKFWNRGVAKSLVKKIVQDIVELDKDFTLKAVVDSENKYSIKLFEKYNFEKKFKDGIIDFERNFFCPKSF